MVLDILSLGIPFFFIAAVVYGAIEVSDVFDNKKIKTIIAAVFALFTLTYEPLILFINQILPYAVIFFIVIFFLAFIFKPLKGEKSGSKDYELIVIITALILLFLANYGYEWIKDLVPQFSNTDFMLAVGGVILVIIFYAAWQHNKGK
jgi:uncharacterized membrane protein